MAETVMEQNANCNMVIDLLADIVLSYLSRRQSQTVPIDIRKTVEFIMDDEWARTAEQEMTARLFGTKEYRKLA